MTKLTVIIFSLVLLCSIFLKLPLNRFIPEQSGDAQLSIFEPLTLLSGNGYFQVRGEPDVWRFEYQMCSMLGWCLQLDNGDNHLETKVRPQRSGIKLTELRFIGNNQALRDLVSPNMASFDITANADQVIIPNIACPTNGIKVLNGSAQAFNINVLGHSFSDISASVLDNQQDQLTIIARGAVEGELNVQPTVYSGRFKVLDLPPPLIAIMSPQQVTSGWAVSGKLSCRS